MIFQSGGPSSPAGQLSQLCIEGSFQDATKINELSTISDVITTEIEHINAEALKELEKTGCNVQPTAQTLLTIQDKFLQKVHLQANGVPLADFTETPNIASAHDAGVQFGYPFMLKNKKMAYDGKGNAVVHNAADVESAFIKLGGTELYAERMVPFIAELAIMVVRTSTGVLEYPVVETVQKDNICHIVTAPAQISPLAMKAAQAVALSAVNSFEGRGVYGVEMFLLNDDSVLLNEVAPRFATYVINCFKRSTLDSAIDDARWWAMILPACLHVCMSACLYVCMFTCLHVCMPVCLPAWMAVSSRYLYSAPSPCSPCGILHHSIGCDLFICILFYSLPPP